MDVLYFSIFFKIFNLYDKFTNEKETILYNEDGDISAAYEDMEALLI